MAKFEKETEPVPFTWPHDCESLWWRVLNGIPFLGPDIRALKKFRQQILTRDETYLNSWSSDLGVLEIRDKLIEMIVGDMEWPCGRFLPLDPCDIIFFETGLDFSSGICISRIEKHFSVEIPISELKNWTFLQLVLFIKDQGAGQRIAPLSNS